MRKPPSRGGAAYDVSERKTFQNAVCQLLHTEFPTVFGPTISQLFAERIKELYERFHPPASHFKVGQVLWTGVAIDDRPTPTKRIEDTKLVPVILDLVTAQDVTETKAGRHKQVRRARIVRLFHQAYRQGAVLSLTDVSLLSYLHCNAISSYVRKHEQETGESVPRRGTIHDLGRSVSHKGIICYKSVVERKPTSQVAQETLHSPEAVERYVQCFRRVQLCRDSGMSTEDIARATGHSLPLVREYLRLIEEFRVPPLPNPARGEDDA
jgi:hypothetical protein